MSSPTKTGSTTAKLAQSLRSGHHATVYEVRRDPNANGRDTIRDKDKREFPFVHGSQYRGQWKMDMKDGFGIQVNPNGTKYEGEWKENKYHGRGTLWSKKGKSFNRTYVGDWCDGFMEGQGIYYYDNGDIYRGGWEKNKRSGKGRMDFVDGNSYDGQWADGSQDGLGTMNYSNGNMYEGLWSKGKKEGPGLFYYASTKKVYQGEWYEDQPQCGEFRSPTTEEELRFVRPLAKGIFHNEFKLPTLQVCNPNSIIDLAVSEVRMHSLNKTFSRMATPYSSISTDNLECAKKLFNSLLPADSDHVSIYHLHDIFHELGLDLSDHDINDIISQLEIRETLGVSFTETVEIASFIHNEKAAIGLV